MKKKIFICVIITSLTAVTIFTGCQTSDSKTKENGLNAKSAKQEVKITQPDINASPVKMSKDKEWKMFQREAEVKIKSNALRCAELRRKMSTSSETFAVLYPKRIADLERKNSKMKLKLAAYNMKQSNLDSFKHEFNQEMDEIGQAFKVLSVESKM